MRARLLGNAGSLGVTLALFACGGGPARTSAPLPGLSSETLQTSAPAVEGIDPVQLAEAYSRAADLAPLHSLLVLKNGALVGEEYFHGASPDTAYNVKSVSKSILSALVGIAIREGYVESVDQPISDFFPEHFEPLPDTLVGWAANPTQTDSLKRRVTVRHLLTHTSGFAFRENELLFWSWFWSSDYVRFYLELPLSSPPGKDFVYSTGGTHTLSAILTRATGLSTLEFGNRYLFGPLGMDVGRWDRSPEGVFIGGSEMHFTARDMAKFGLLFLNEGLWNGDQIVPREWARESTAEQVRADYESPTRGPVPETWTSPHYPQMNHTGYGYLWWRRDTVGHDTYVALGYGGQLVFVIPDLDLVVVTLSAWDERRNPDRWAHYKDIYRILDDHIVPSVGESTLERSW